MQAISVISSDLPYDGDMQTGRPPKYERPPQGKRIAKMREQAGLSQQQLADALGVKQQMIAYWERRAVTLRPEQLASLAETLKVSVDDLLGKPKKTARGTGPTGKMRQLFETASKLPRRQQEKIVEFVEPYIERQQAQS